ncbi:MAG: hypothetical protein ACTSWY_16105 [Promethearchaeota archaeon]
MNEEIPKKEKIPEAEEIKGILSAVSTEVPGLIKNIFASLYSSDIAAEYGKGIGQLYKELKEQGLPEDMIRKVVMEYASSINVLGNVLKSETKNITNKEEEEEE